MHLHGCGNTVDGIFYGYQSLSDGGWMEYAVANDIILILPQAKFDLIFNSDECFDYFNYATWWDSKAYITKNGVQIKALKGMLDRLLEPLDKKYDYKARNILQYGNLEFVIRDFLRFTEASPSWVTHATYLTFTWFLPGFFMSLFGIEFRPTRAAL